MIYTELPFCLRRKVAKLSRHFHIDFVPPNTARQCNPQGCKPPPVCRQCLCQNRFIVIRVEVERGPDLDSRHWATRHRMNGSNTRSIVSAFPDKRWPGHVQFEYFPYSLANRNNSRNKCRERSAQGVRGDCV